MSMKLRSVLIAALCVALASAVHLRERKVVNAATSLASQVASDFNAADKNHDGQLSPAEFQGAEQELRFVEVGDPETGCDPGHKYVAGSPCQACESGTVSAGGGSPAVEAVDAGCAGEAPAAIVTGCGDVQTPTDQASCEVSPGSDACQFHAADASGGKPTPAACVPKQCTTMTEQTACGEVSYCTFNADAVGAQAATFPSECTQCVAGKFAADAGDAGASTAATQCVACNGLPTPPDTTKPDNFGFAAAAGAITCTACLVCRDGETEGKACSAVGNTSCETPEGSTPTAVVPAVR